MEQFEKRCAIAAQRLEFVQTAIELVANEEIIERFRLEQSGQPVPPERIESFDEKIHKLWQEYLTTLYLCLGVNEVNFALSCMKRGH